MTRNLGSTDYIGTSGGFTVRGGRYFGSAAGKLNLASSGTMLLLSQNDDINVTASGQINVTSLAQGIALAAPAGGGTISATAGASVSLNAGQLNLVSNPNEINITAVTDVLIQALKAGTFATAGGQLSLGSIGAGYPVFILGPRGDANKNGGGILLLTNTSIGGLGSISGISGSELHLHASGFMDLGSENAATRLMSSGLLTVGNRINPYCMAIQPNVGKPVFGADNRFPALNCSGQINGPTTNLEVGDLWSVLHSQGSGILEPGVNTQALITAKSLGPASILFNSGSGIMNVSFGSGVVQVTNLAAQNIATRTPTKINWSLTGVGSGISDNFFAVGSDSVTILVAGLYRLSYKIGLALTAGTTQTTFKAEAYRTIPGGTAASMSNAKSYAPVNSTNAVRSNATNGYGTLFNANAGDIIDIRGSYDQGFSGNTSTLTAGESTLCLEYIGPAR